MSRSRRSQPGQRWARSSRRRCALAYGLGSRVLARLAGSGALQLTPPTLLALLAAGAPAPLLTGGAALVTATAAIAAVGGNVLTDIVRSGVDRLRPARPHRPSETEVQRELEERMRQVLEAGGADADALRAELARVLAEVGVVGAAMQAAVESGDRELQATLAEGLDGLGSRFAEFEFVLADLGTEVRAIRAGVDAQGGRLLQVLADLELSVGLQYRQAADSRVLLERIDALSRRAHLGRLDAQEGMPPDQRRWAGGCPYQGLTPFGQADARVFYGRKR